MRTTLLLAGFALTTLPLTGCDSTGIDDGECVVDCFGTTPGTGQPGTGGGNTGGGNTGGGNTGGGNTGGGNTGGGNTGGGNTGGGTGGGTKTSSLVTVNPRQTYILTSANDLQDVDAPAVRLSDLGYAPGQPVCFRAEGDFTFTPGARASKRSSGIVTAVFSSTADLLNGDNRHRVTGAIDAGTDIVTQPTALDAIATDVPEDFDATNTCLTVPAGAQFVFFGINDTYFTDNDNIDGVGFGVRVSNK